MVCRRSVDSGFQAATRRAEVRRIRPPIWRKVVRKLSEKRACRSGRASTGGVLRYSHLPDREGLVGKRMTRIEKRKICNRGRRLDLAQVSRRATTRDGCEVRRKVFFAVQVRQRKTLRVLV